MPCHWAVLEAAWVHNFHCKQSSELLKAIQLPKKLGIVHQPAHTGGRTKEEIGNGLADVAAEAQHDCHMNHQAYKQCNGPTWCCPLLKIQLTVPAEEADSWKEKEMKWKRK